MTLGNFNKQTGAQVETDPETGFVGTDLALNKKIRDNQVVIVPNSGARLKDGRIEARHLSLLPD